MGPVSARISIVRSQGKFRGHCGLLPGRNQARVDEPCGAKQRHSTECCESLKELEGSLVTGSNECDMGTLREVGTVWKIDILLGEKAAGGGEVLRLDGVDYSTSTAGHKKLKEVWIGTGSNWKYKTVF